MQLKLGKTPGRKLEQSERMRSENTPYRRMIIIHSYRIPFIQNQIYVV